MPEPIRVAVVGSRGYPKPGAVVALVDRLAAKGGYILVSGGARGVDSIAEDEAKRIGLPAEIHHADWAAHGKSAGPKRNKQMVDASSAVVAFWDTSSRGTAHTIVMAADAGILKKVYGPDGEPLEYESVVHKARLLLATGKGKH
jgi:hypothetical protein